MEIKVTKAMTLDGRLFWMHSALACGVLSILLLIASSASALFLEEMDFGDAPAIYLTLAADEGARHAIDPGLLLGSVIDAELDGLPSLLAGGDDLDGSPDDEDGIVFASLLIPGERVDVDASASLFGYLNAWIDFNADGDWNDAGEMIFTDTALAAGVNSLSFVVPADAIIGTTYTRFRLNSTGGLSSTGLASDGEVEDYQVSIASVPEPGTFTLLVLGLVGLHGVRRC